METLLNIPLLQLSIECPYSLGKLIEWKPKFSTEYTVLSNGSYSLGKLIEWKLLFYLVATHYHIKSLLARETN